MPIHRQPACIRSIPRRFTVSVVLLALFLPGCVVGDFMSVYFNNFYNAQRLFSDAEDEVWNLPETRLSGRNMMAVFTISPATKTKFTQVIEKCSKLLQYHPDSRYVDDALLMIAKSYFYQGAYQQGVRKCAELINGFPGSDLQLETNLLLACSLYKGNRKEEAQAAAEKVVATATEEGEDDILARVSVVLAAIQADAKNYAEARVQYQRAADKGKDVDFRSAALERTAEMYALMHDYAAAQETYGRQADVSDNYVGQFRGQIGTARMLDKQGKYKDALDLLQSLRENANNREFFGEISLEIANVYRDMGDLDMAVEQYHRVDTTYARTEASANSYYQLGLLYEGQLFRYDSARVTYNKGRGEWPQALVTPEINRRADYLNRYSQFRADLHRLDSLRAVLQTKHDTTDSTVVLTDSSRAKPEVAADTLRRRSPTPSVPVPMSIDSIDSRRANIMDELATLFYATMGRTDSAVTWYHRLLNEFPDGPFVPRALYTLAQISSLDSSASRPATDSLYWVIIKRFPETSFASEARRLLGLPPEARKIDPSLVLYGKAEELIDSGQGLAAADSLKEFLRLYPGSALAAKAEYSLGWLYENVTMQPESAYAHYDRVVRLYPGTPFAMRVLPKVMDPEVRARILPKPDTTAHGVPPGNVQPPPPPPPGNQQPPPDREQGKGKLPEEPPGNREPGTREPHEGVHR